MSVSSIFNNAFRFPFSAMDKWLILGVLLVIGSLSSILVSWGIDLGVASIITSIIALIAGFISIIPVIVFFALLIVTGAAEAFIEIINLTMGGATTVPSDLALKFVGSLGITLIISLILFIVFSLFSTIAMCRLANTGSFSQGFAFSEIIGDFKRIGVGSFIAWWIVLAIISLVLVLISVFISAVPYIGYVVSILFIYSFIAIFASRATGLIYSN